MALGAAYHKIVSPLFSRISVKEVKLQEAGYFSRSRYEKIYLWISSVRSASCWGRTGRRVIEWGALLYFSAPSTWHPYKAFPLLYSPLLITANKGRSLSSHFPACPLLSLNKRNQRSFNSWLLQLFSDLLFTRMTGNRKIKSRGLFSCAHRSSFRNYNTTKLLKAWEMGKALPWSLYTIFRALEIRAFQ